MKAIVWRWCIAVSLLGGLLTAGHPPTHAQAAASGGSHVTATPSNPRNLVPDESKKKEDSSNQRARDKRAKALEEQLQRGEVDQAIAQGQVSDHLEQLHKGSAETRIAPRNSPSMP